MLDYPILHPEWSDERLREELKKSKRESDQLTEWPEAEEIVDNDCEAYYGEDEEGNGLMVEDDDLTDEDW